MSDRFPTEAALHSAVSAYLARLAIPHTNQHPVAAGRADLCIELPDGRPWCLVELKNNLDPETLDLADAADYFEQAAKYSLNSGLPVFVGPFFVRGAGVISQYLTGGHTARSVAALSAIGGRANVGLLFLRHVTGHRATPAAWRGFQMTLRQQRVASHDCEHPDNTIWPEAIPPLVAYDTAGSRRDRRTAVAP